MRRLSGALRLDRLASTLRCLPMLDLIEDELGRLRKMVARTDNGLLLYLVELALREANRMARDDRNGEAGPEIKSQTSRAILTISSPPH